jgi:sugar-specific transcriptional regulator TrmB
VNGLKYNQERPRAKGVTRKKEKSDTVSRNALPLTRDQERLDLSSGLHRRTRLSENPDYKDFLQIWPKIVEYIGLSEYESKVYLSLINLGTTEARKLSLNCDVPRTKVYGTLKKLIDYGLVVEIPGHPKQFAPSNPGESFNTILNITKEKALDFDTIIKKLDEVHEKRKETIGPQKKLIWFMDKNHNIKGKCNEIIRQSEEDVNILTTEDGLEVLFNAAHRLLDEMQESGVEIKLYSPLDPKTNPLARELSYIYQVKQVEVETPIMFVNSDNKRFILAKLAPRGSEKPFESAMFTEDKELLDLVHLLLVDGQKQLLQKALQP